MTKLYAERDPDEIEPYRMKHLLAMTAEGLHSKADIADELSYRDKEIARLTQCLHKANEQAEHFEREWYLRGDEIERLKQEIAAENDEVNGLNAEICGFENDVCKLEGKIVSLRNALREIKEHDEAKMYASCPDCDYEGVCEKTGICKSMTHSKAGEIALKALEESNDN